MSNGHKTSAVARPRAAAARRVAPVRTRAHPPTRQIASNGFDTGQDRLLVTRRPHRWLLAFAGVAVVVAIVAALFVLPVQAWLRQEDEIVQKQQELSVLTEANRKLGTEVDHLGTPAGAKEAARDELGVVGPGEDRISVLPIDTGPLPLPSGWPYDTFARIVAVRQSVPTASVTP
jgi:cell division protein FtsB